MSTRAWDASTYHTISCPQAAMAEAVLDRLELRGDETVLDAGCGSGRVTAALLDRLPRGRVVAVDADAGMVAHARDALPPDRAEVHQHDLAALVLAAPVDAAFSNAVFHWIPDHDALFAALARALRPGGRLSAQCGGRGNVARVQAAADAIVASDTELRDHFAGWSGPWHFAGPQDTEARLRNVGFTAVACWLEPWPVSPDEVETYLRTICLGPYLERVPEAQHAAFAREVAGRVGGELDYVRLNIVARVPSEAVD
ncbi:MAG: methyltransferase domain-containing protein [Solirubrobacteraceae bacterium MAG38_C4-C5]|nr:methyltransferase domain-containing protein [Candidatus Siliceabacter maunaloa]